MSLKKYNCCDSAHSADFQYVCLREKKVFCMKCWFKVEHYRHCQSTRCGQYMKFAHLTLNRALQYKNSKILEEMLGSHSVYQSLRVNFMQLNFQVTEILKDFVEQKIPLFFWGMVNEVLKGKYGQQLPVSYNKFDSYCTEMIRIIRSTDSSLKQEYLQNAIGAYFDINHQLEGQINLIRTNKIHKQPNKQVQVQDVLDKTKDNISDMLNRLKKGFRATMDLEIEKTCQLIDPSTTFKGVTFQKITAENECFRKREQYPYLNLVTQKYSQISDEVNDLHMGFHLNMPELQSNPEQLLQVGKCLIKERLLQVYEGVRTLKSSFPYKYAYPIATTLSADQDYEQVVVDLQRVAIEASDKANPFLSSLCLVIMGREVIVIRFHNQPRFCYSRIIYNFSPERHEYYDILLEKLGIRNIYPREDSQQNIPYNEHLSQTELAYCNFYIAVENIFAYSGEPIIFEGEKVMAKRGAELFTRVIDAWKKTAKINLEFSNPLSHMIKYFIWKFPIIMIAKCCFRFKSLSLRLMRHSLPKWHTHLTSFCSLRANQQPWCSMFLDNIDLITQLTLPKEVQTEIRNTNVATEIVGIISKHYEEEHNLFKFCIELFGSYVKLKYSETINPSKQTLLRIATECQNFTQLLADLFVLYYHLEDREIVGQQTFYKSTLPNLANQLTFQNIEISNTVQRTSKGALKAQIDKIQFQLQRVSQHPIQYFQVRKELQLNEETLVLFGVKKKVKEDQVYLGACQVLREVIRVSSPAEKLKLVKGIAKQIQSSVHCFYQKHHISFRQLEIATQDLHSIFTYLLVQLNQPAFYAHLQIVLLFNNNIPSETQPILDGLLAACQNLENGLSPRRQSEISQLQPIPRKGSDSLGFFDEVTSNFDL